MGLRQRALVPLLLPATLGSCSAAVEAGPAAPTSVATTTPTTTTRPPATTATTAARAPVTTRTPTTSSAGCHSSYVGACLPVDASDVDCAGGSGNGPVYTSVKRFQVVGTDAYGLDSDGDGIACES